MATGTAAVDADHRIIHDSGTGRIFYDADGSGTTAAAIQFATLPSGTVLTNADFAASIDEQGACAIKLTAPCCGMLGPCLHTRYLRFFP